MEEDKEWPLFIRYQFTTTRRRRMRSIRSTQATSARTAVIHWFGFHQTNGITPTME